MRWVALLAVLFLVPTALAFNATVGLPANAPALFTPQMTCSVVLQSSTTESCDGTGVVSQLTTGRIVVTDGASASYFIKDLTNMVIAGHGACSTTTSSASDCVAQLDTRITGQARVLLTVSGPNGASATVVFDRESI